MIDQRLDVVIEVLHDRFCRSIIVLNADMSRFAAAIFASTGVLEGMESWIATAEPSPHVGPRRLPS